MIKVWIKFDSIFYGGICSMHHEFTDAISYLSKFRIWIDVILIMYNSKNIHRWLFYHSVIDVHENAFIPRKSDHE